MKQKLKNLLGEWKQMRQLTLDLLGSVNILNEKGVTPRDVNNSYI